MRQKIIIGGAVLLLIVVVVLMVKDMYNNPTATKSNPYEYTIDSFKDIDTSLYCYKEVKRFSPIIEKLRGIAIDNDDDLYLTGLQKVMIYNKDLEFQKGFKINSEAKNISVSDSKQIFLGVSDHVEVWNVEGTQLDSWNRYNDRSVITSIVVGESSVYVADAGNKVILQYDFTGELLKEIGKKDSLNGRTSFIIPSPFFDVAIGREGELIAVNSGLHAFESYNSMGELASFWERTSMQLDGFSGCCNPSHMAVLADGAFVTSEKGLIRVKIHEPNGDFRCVVEGPNAFEEGTKGLDIAVNSSDDIFLIVPNSKEVRVYSKKN
ncbi:MAG: hypothetical protein PF517_18320 [Salinivirgaceae bacterium]|jgi:hypothetical protein|nr:hypothetical protein [Salinivirgaceae bacterium]